MPLTKPDLNNPRIYHSTGSKFPDFIQIVSRIKKAELPKIPWSDPAGESDYKWHNMLIAATISTAQDMRRTSARVGIGKIPKILAFHPRWSTEGKWVSFNYEILNLKNSSLLAAGRNHGTCCTDREYRQIGVPRDWSSASGCACVSSAREPSIPMSAQPGGPVSSCESAASTSDPRLEIFVSEAIETWRPPPKRGDATPTTASATSLTEYEKSYPEVLGKTNLDAIVHRVTFFSRAIASGFGVWSLRADEVSHDNMEDLMSEIERVGLANTAGQTLAKVKRDIFERVKRASVVLESKGAELSSPARKILDRLQHEMELTEDLQEGSIM